MTVWGKTKVREMVNTISLAALVIISRGGCEGLDFRCNNCDAPINTGKTMIPHFSVEPVKTCQELTNVQLYPRQLRQSRPVHTCAFGVLIGRNDSIAHT